MASGDLGDRGTLELVVNGRAHQIEDRGDTLLDVLRFDLGLKGAKDGCSPQGQCGCCTVLVDGLPRVACVTPARRVRGRSVTTIEGLDPERAKIWGDALCTSGGSQCGFCTPGIVLRLEGAADRMASQTVTVDAKAACELALLAHLCRCTGWQTITEAFSEVVTSGQGVAAVAAVSNPIDRAHRVQLEGGEPQHITPATVMGGSGFAADTAPADSLIAVLDAAGDWAVGSTLAQARQAAGKVQGRRTTMEHHHPVPAPEGDFIATLQTTWTDPAYLETDASWCSPGGTPASSRANGGAFGGKTDGQIERAAQTLANRHERTVLALYSREDSMRLGPKRPPVAGGVRADGTGVLRVAETAGARQLLALLAPEFEIEMIEIAGPPTSLALRAALWAEVAVLRSALQDPHGPIEITSPNGSQARVSGGPEGIDVTVSAGPVLDPAVFRSYCIGAAHMGWSWATAEAMTVNPEGDILDLTIRSLGIVRPVDTPPINVRLEPGEGPAVNGSDAVFAAAAALAWRCSGFGPQWPLGPLSS